MCMTSPPYWGLRDYGVDGQLGLEDSPGEYVAKLVAVFREVRRVLKEDGTLWLNLGDSYASGPGGQHGKSTWMGGRSVTKHQGRAPVANSLKPKDLVGIPWRVALALQQDGWWLRSDIIWAKPNPMPESVKDRPTSSHEHLFLLAKSKQYHYDHEAIKEPSVSDHPSGNGYERSERLSMNGRGSDEGWTPTKLRNKRDVWTISTKPYPEAHFAVYPEDLCIDPIKAGSGPGDTVLDPFAGAGTTLKVARDLGRDFVGIELNPEYIELINKRLAQVTLPLWSVNS